MCSLDAHSIDNYFRYWGGIVVTAEDTIKPGTQIIISDANDETTAGLGNGSLVSVNPDKKGQLTKDNIEAGDAIVWVDGAQIKTFLGIELYNTSGKYSTGIALGKNARVRDDRYRATYALLMGNKDANGTALYTSGIAIGENSYSLPAGVSLGVRNYNGQMGGIVLGNGKHDLNGTVGIGSTAVGANNYVGGTLASSYGSYNIMTNEGTHPDTADPNVNYKQYASYVRTQNAGAVTMGALNSIQSLDSFKLTAGVASSVIGLANQVKNSNTAVVIGAGNSVVDSYQDMNLPWGSSFFSVPDSVDKTAEAIRNPNNKTYGGSVSIIGGRNQVKNSRGISLSGNGNVVDHGDSLFMAGEGNEADYVRHSLILGSQVKIQGTEKAALEGILSFGDQNEVTKSYGVAVGAGTKVNGQGAVALGSQSQVLAADRLTDMNYVSKGDWDAASGAGSAENTFGVISVGASSGNQSFNRRIINVANGRISADSKDAVNGSQLRNYQVKDGDMTFDTATKTLKLHWTDMYGIGNAYDTSVKLSDIADGTSKTDYRLLNESYSVDADGNVTLHVKDSNDANAKAEDVVISGIASKSYVDDKITELNTKIDNIKPGDTKHSAVSAGKGIDVKNSPNIDGSINYQVSLQDSFTLGDEKGKNVKIDGTNGQISATESISVGTTSISKEGVKVGDKTYISESGFNANGQKITNVAEGTADTDAVNVSQLKKATSDIVNIAGNVARLDSRVNRVGAGAAALAALQPLDFDPDAKWDFSAGYGNYAGASAVAVGAYYRPNEDVMFSIGGSMGGGENMMNAGVSVKVGAGNSSHANTSKIAMAKEFKDLRATVEKQSEQIAQLMAVVNTLTGKADFQPRSGAFPDVPKNHWAYEAVEDLRARGFVHGFPNGTFKGDRLFTRYEFAQVVHNALLAGAPDSQAVRRLKAEFAPELERFTVDTIQKDNDGNPTVERVRVVKPKK